VEEKLAGIAGIPWLVKKDKKKKESREILCREFYCQTRRSSVRYTATFDTVTGDSSSSPTASINESTSGNNGQTIKPKFQTRRENVKLRKRNGGRAVEAAAHLDVARDPFASCSRLL